MKKGTNRNRSLWIVALVLFVLASAGWASAVYFFAEGKATAEQTAQDVAQPADDLAASVLRACRAGGLDAKKLEAQGSCRRAAETRKTIDDSPVETTTPTTPTTSPRTLYVPVPGPRGPVGPPGKATNGRDGTDGLNGADSTVPGPAGEDSTVPGPQGPSGPAGADGKDGTNGTDGRDGVSITDVACTGGLAPVTFTFTYSDGRTQQLTCGQLDPVEPTPSE